MMGMLPRSFQIFPNARDDDEDGNGWFCRPNGAIDWSLKLPSGSSCTSEGSVQAGRELMLRGVLLLKVHGSRQTH